MSFAYKFEDIIRTLGPAERQSSLRSAASPALRRSTWPCGCVVDASGDAAPDARWESCPAHANRAAAAAPVAADLSAFSVSGKRLAVADPWTFEAFMTHLAACAQNDAAAERRELAALFLQTLPEAVIRRRCNCGDSGCRTYFFVDAPSFAGEIEVLEFPARPGDYLLIVYAPSRKLLSVELYIED